MSISWADFEKIDIRTGTILEVSDFPTSRKPAYQLVIDFGDEIGMKKSSAQITVHYSKEDLVNRQVVAVVNFAPKQIGTFMSECLVLGVYDEEGAVVLLKAAGKVKNGAKIG
jgi:tRNA-binding protein